MSKEVEQCQRSRTVSDLRNCDYFNTFHTHKKVEPFVRVLFLPLY